MAKSRVKKGRSPSDLLPGLVLNWGGFELFVADLNKTAEDVSVEHDVTLIDRSGVPRQIDVVLRYRKGLVRHLVIIECKYWKRNVSREKVDAFAQAVDELNADRGIIFSVVGFQSGAIKSAAANGISLFKVREPTPGEWGAPGRHVDLYLAVVFRSVGACTFPGTMALVPNTNSGAPLAGVSVPENVTVGDGTLAPHFNINMNIGADNPTSTPVVLGDGTSSTLEEQMFLRSLDAARQIYATETAKGLPFFPDNGCRRVWHWHMTLFSPMPLLSIAPPILIPIIRMQVGIAIMQSRIKIDRAKNYTFAIAVEDCVSNAVTGATRRPGEALTSVFDLKERVDPSDAIQNGSLITVWAKDMFPFDDFAHLAEGQVESGELPHADQSQTAAEK